MQQAIHCFTSLGLKSRGWPSKREAMAPSKCASLRLQTWTRQLQRCVLWEPKARSKHRKWPRGLSAGERINSGMLHSGCYSARRESATHWHDLRGKAQSSHAQPENPGRKGAQTPRCHFYATLKHKNSFRMIQRRCQGLGGKAGYEGKSGKEALLGDRDFVIIALIVPWVWTSVKPGIVAHTYNPSTGKASSVQIT